MDQKDEILTKNFFIWKLVKTLLILVHSVEYNVSKIIIFPFFSHTGQKTCEVLVKKRVRKGLFIMSIL